MTQRIFFTLALFISLAGPQAGWAEQKAAVAPPAQAGEIMVIYRSRCPAEAQASALENIKRW